MFRGGVEKKGITKDNNTQKHLPKFTTVTEKRQR